MDTKTDLKALARLLAQRRYPTQTMAMPAELLCQEVHERAILPFLDLLINRPDWMQDHPSDCDKSMSFIKPCSCGLSAYLDKINAVLDQH